MGVLLVPCSYTSLHDPCCCYAAVALQGVRHREYSVEGIQVRVQRKGRYAGCLAAPVTSEPRTAVLQYLAA